MENLLAVATQVGVLFVLMAVGALCRLSGLIDDSARKGMVNLLILVVTPCLIVDVFQRPFDPAELSSLAISFSIAVAVHLAAIAIAYLAVRHRSDSTRRVLLLSAVFSNAGFMGIPLEQAILGERGVFFGIAYVVVFNFFMWSWGLATMKGEAGFSRTLVVNPGTAGLAVGLPLFFLSLRLPQVFASPVHHVAALNTPLAMIIVGHYLAGAKLASAASDPAAWLAMALRLAGLPLLVTACLYPFRAVLDRTMMLAIVTASSAPVAAMVSMLASKYGRDVDTSVGVISASTLLSIATIPCIVASAMEIL